MLCSKCQTELTYIKAGVSKKTGKPYNAFYSCPNCKATQNITSERQAAPDKFKAQLEQNGETEGRVRHGVVVAVIEKEGINAVPLKIQEINKAVQFIMTGQYPSPAEEDVPCC